MKRLRLKSPADTDYVEAIAWYEGRQPGLGKEFEVELEALFERIKRNPELFRKESGNVRKARMPRFKYGVYFTIEGDEIGVVAIYHPSRNPNALRRRFA
ncbi:MAG TPA: type II toxin-antitoxin system RelE/ParE family toxin [Verrucomicrobiae bacterium]|jgi:plasmid stabilization system protein ParE